MSVQVQDYWIAGQSAAAIASSVERGVDQGRLAPGAQLPPVRALAGQLGVSPATVASAYRRLRDRGVAVSANRRGVFIAPRPPLPTPVGEAMPEGVVDLASGNPDPALLPAMPDHNRGRPTRLYDAAPVLPALAELARHQFATDGVPTDHLTVTSGAMDAIERVLAAHLRPGDAVAVEDPGFAAVFDLLRSMGLDPSPVTIDGRGMPADALAAAIDGGAAAVLLTPRAHNPTGAALDTSRAEELAAAIAAHPDILVIEDDHAGVVAGTNYHRTAHEARRWATIRSATKSLGPDLRLAVAAGDPETIARVQGRLELGPGWISYHLQHAVAALWADPDIQQLLQQAAATYQSRREALLAALAQRGIDAMGPSGLNVWVSVPDEGAVLTALQHAGWAVRSGQRYRLNTPPAVRITTAALPEHHAHQFAASLQRVLHPSIRPARA